MVSCRTIQGERDSEAVNVVWIVADSFRQDQLGLYRMKLQG
jgi:hypothetical protein